MLCTHALNSDNQLVFIDDVPNGKSCNCHCPACGENLIAKNGGKTSRKHHFAHESGVECAGYRETILHIWCKQIIENRKQISIPKYNSTTNGYLLINPYDEQDFGLTARVFHFVAVEVEQRTDLKELQPDIVGITSDGLRLWIEIYVTHKCSENKISIIKENNINCIEIQIPDGIETKDDLESFLINSTDASLKCFINYPYGDSIILKNKKEYYCQLKQKYKLVKMEDCQRCFKEKIIPNNYIKLLDEYNGLLDDKFSYIFRCKDIKQLIEKYPKLAYLGDAVYHKWCSYKKNSITELSEKDFEKTLDFSFRLSNLIKFYGYGSVNSFHWNCSHIFAMSSKNNKESVFCELS